jgi:8-amino-7-oxononanoate synthase
MRRTPHAAAQLLQALQQDHLRRTRRSIERHADPVSTVQPVVDGRVRLNFCGNDYLGLARDPRLAQALAAAAGEWGLGSGASHLVSGHSRAHHALEERLAAFTGREAALLFSTGYMANVGVVSALVNRGELVLQDRLNHASLLDGALLSGARLLRYRHGAVDEAARRLDASDARGRLLATDGVFSMDGDIAPVAALAQIAQRRSAWLLVDDAHGLGVLGEQGGGALELAGLSAQQVPLLVGTLGKAFGCSGAFVAGDRDLIDCVMQRARSYVYTTALPPALAAAAVTAVDLVATEGWRRRRVAELVAHFRSGALREGLPLADSQTPIQPLMLGDPARALAASAQLWDAGFWVTAIRAPTVPRGTERLRVTLSAAHTDAQVDALVTALAQAIRATAVAA